MYEAHGWFGIYESPRDINEGKLEQILESLQKLIDSVSWTSVHMTIHRMKGEHFLQVLVLSKRGDAEAKFLDQVLEFLCREAPGSYGLLYWIDDDSMEPPGPLVFRVKVLARGQVLDRFDPFLSPTMPVIEDEWSGDDTE